MTKDEISNHCLCDKCDGSECNIFSEEELADQKKDNENKIKSECLRQFAMWCRSPVVDRQIREFKVYMEIPEEEAKRE